LLPKEEPEETEDHAMDAPRRTFISRRAARPSARPRPLPGAIAGCLLLLLLGAGTLSAQRPAEVEIDVVDGAGNPLADVAVAAVSADGGDFRYDGTTNKKGKLKASIEGPAGTYVFTFEKAGFAVEEVRIDLQPGMSTTARIPLVDPERKKKGQAVDAFNEGVALLQAGKEEEALAKYQEAIVLDPDLAEGHRLVALITANRGDLETAGASLDRFLELQPDGLAQVSPAAYVVYRKRGDAARVAAAREGLKAIGAASDIAGTVFNEGVAAVRKEDFAAARAAFQEALDLDPKLAPAYQSLAALHFNAGEFAEALPHLEKLLAIVPAHAEGLRMSFYSHLSLEHADAAAAAAKSWFAAVANARQQALVQSNKYFEGNQSAQAQRLLQAVLAADPELAEAHYQMGKVMAAQGNVAAAKEHLQKFLQLAPDHAEAAAARQMLAGL
jgi:tetratricopeptide (TPR) repeat protein